MTLAKRLHDLTESASMDASEREALRLLIADVALLESEAHTLRKLHDADAMLIETLTAELDALTAPERDTKTIELELKP